MLPGTEQFPYVSCEKQCAVGYFQSDPEIKKLMINKGQEIAEAIILSFIVPQKKTILSRISALATKMGQIKKITTHYHTI
jgi:hypothetical protein